MKVITSERIPIKMWAESIEDGAMEQAKNLANMPYSHRHIAIMPDSHQGFGMPIGAVLATQNAIVINAIGVDINCGMNAVNAEMNFCSNYADISRNLMMHTFVDDLQEVIPEVTILDSVSISHNFVRSEKHFGQSLWIHRKGAVPADGDTRGIIAGSQGTASYIVQGLGNRESFMTCSHGAGRVLGRKEAVRKLSLNEEQEKMKGIYNNMNSQEKLDEAPSCYKDIDEVMRQQEDLAQILVKLTPLGVVKG